MIPSTCHQNIDSVSLDGATSTLGHLHKNSHTTLPSILFRSDLPLLDHIITDEKLMVEFLLRDICCCIDIKDYSPKQVNLCKHIWEVIIYMIIIDKDCLNPDI